MAGGSLIFKQDSEYYEHFYHQLEPWVHYVPLKQDISDIEEKLQWAIEHDDEVSILWKAHAYQGYLSLLFVSMVTGPYQGYR